jgi:ribosomal protein S18 acetylase RimI-like enzyme
LTSSPLPDGFSVRAATEDDAGAASDVYRAAELAVHGRSLFEPKDLLSWWRLADLSTGTFLVHEGDRAAATATMLVRGGVAEFSGAVHPEYRGRGLGNALVGLAEQRARQAGLRSLRVDVHAEDGRAVELLTNRGHRDVRHFYVMGIGVTELPPPPDWPPGIRGDTFRPEDAPAFHAVLTEAFAEEWGAVAMEFDEWRRLRIEADDFDPGLWFVARGGNEIVAVARCERLFGGGWISSLGVLKPWRRRGLGLALLRRAFREFHERGEHIVRLGVDSQNTTGATRLYERAGMTLESERVVYEKPLAE